MTSDTVFELSKIKNIKGIKEASGNLEQVCEIIAKCGENIDVISGDDALLLPMLSVGAKGVVSVTANFMAKEISQLINLFEKGDLAGARKIHEKLFFLNQNMFVETNPVPVKAAMEILGKLNKRVRLPLTEASDSTMTLLKNLIEKVEIL